MEESEGNNDLKVKGFSLIDVSSKNDSLIAAAAAASSSNLTDHQSSETQDEPRSFELTGDLGANKVVNMTLTNGQNEHLPQLLETSGPERSRKTGKCNLRKSLAWDSAFFEGPGVLDAEELSSMIEGAEKGKKHLLPGIEEDICRSTESISTLESENLTLESLEAELFEDTKASIQKSSKVSNMTNLNRKAASGGTGNQVNCCKYTIYPFSLPPLGDVWRQGTWGSRMLIGDNYVKVFLCLNSALLMPMLHLKLMLPPQFLPPRHQLHINYHVYHIMVIPSPASPHLRSLL